MTGLNEKFEDTKGAICCLVGAIVESSILLYFCITVTNMFNFPYNKIIENFANFLLGSVFL
jgi:hypothetical protein